MLKIKWYHIIFTVLLFTLGYCTVSIVNEFRESKRLSELPDKTQSFRYPKPLNDTDVMNVLKAGYLMGIEREDFSKWQEDSTMFRKYILKQIKPNQNDYSKTN